MERTSLTFQTFKNISYSIVGYIWPMFFSLVVTPIVILHLGVKNYGIFLFITLLSGLFGLLDLGLNTAVTKHMSYYWGKKDFASMQILTHSSNSLSFIIGLVGFISLTCIGFFGPHLLPTQFASYQAYSSLFFIAGLMFMVGAITATYNIILAALQRFDISNKIGIVSTAVSSLTILFVVMAGGSIASMLLIQLFYGVIFSGITIYIIQKLLPQATFRFGWNTKEIKHCYRFGLIVFINNIGGTTFSSLDRLIIPFYAGPSNLTYYSIPISIGTRIPGIANTLAATMFPMTSQLDGENNKLKIETLYVRSFRLITIVSAAFTVTTIAFSYKILFYWLGINFADNSANILIILAFTNFILALLGPLSNFLLGLNKVKFITIMSVIMAIINVILLLILLPKYGITGAAWAYLLSVLPVMYIFYYTEKKYLTLSNRGHYYVKKITGTLVTSLLIWIIDAYLLSPLIVNMLTLLMIGGCSVVLYLILYKSFGLFDTTDWTDFENFFKVAMRKLRLQK